MILRKAVITAAGRAQRLLPLQRLVDRDGVEKTALRIVIEEVVSSGIEEICVVICPGDQAAYHEAAGDHAGRLTFVTQDNPKGYGDAIARAAAFTAGEAFLHLVGDHLYVSKTDQRCTQQLVETARRQQCAVSAVQPTREGMLPYYGAVGGTRVPREQNLYKVEAVLEKPTPTQAEQTLIVPGLRSGQYLCFFGMHVLTPPVMTILAQLVAATPQGQSVQLSPALEMLAQRERYLALEVRGWRYNVGVRYGLMTAQLALGLAGNDRDEILAGLVELLATGSGRGA